MKRISWDAVALAVVASGSCYKLISGAMQTEIADAVSASSFAPNSHVSKYINKSVVDKLNKTGLVVIEDVIPHDILRGAQNGAQAIFQEGRLECSANASTVRQDQICWIRASDGITDDKVEKLNPAMLFCLEFLRGIALDLETSKYTRSKNHKVAQQAQLSRYSADGLQSYRPHRDASTTDNVWDMGLLGWLRARDYRRRKITAILYLNDQNWDAAANADGGALCCYSGADAADVTGETKSEEVRVSPTGGTLVLFDSTELLHAVAPSNRVRYALAVWITGEETEYMK